MSVLSRPERATSICTACKLFSSSSATAGLIQLPLLTPTGCARKGFLAQPEVEHSTEGELPKPPSQHTSCSDFSVSQFPMRPSARCVRQHACSAAPRGAPQGSRAQHSIGPKALRGAEVAASTMAMQPSPSPFRPCAAGSLLRPAASVAAWLTLTSCSMVSACTGSVAARTCHASALQVPRQRLGNSTSASSALRFAPNAVTYCSL